MSDPVARRQGSWSTLRPLLRSAGARSVRRIGAAVTRAHWALVAALIGGTAVWLVMPAVVRRTLGGDCRLFVEPVGLHLDHSGTLVLDQCAPLYRHQASVTCPNTLLFQRDSCPLSHPEVVAVWLVALIVAVLAGLVTRRLVGGRR